MDPLGLLAFAVRPSHSTSGLLPGDGQVVQHAHFEPRVQLASVWLNFQGSLERLRRLGWP